ncbi:hypothetical protein H113_02451 [Trichophyton rubrum MR1459]|nr:hypothetical protein H113_02451 [Trichophyton rubrum MR1459]
MAECPVGWEPAAGGSSESEESNPEDEKAARLNQIVIDYLAKKGYNRTEAIFRMESSNQEIDGRPLLPVSTDTHPKFRAAFGL